MTLLRPQSQATQGAGGAAKPAGWPWPDEMDALVAAPKHHRLLFENDRVRVLDTRIAPGDTVPLHTHCWPAAHHFMSWSDFIRRDEHGTVQADTRGKPAVAAGSVLWSGPLGPHTLENVGPAELHVISTELKDDVRPGNV